MKATISTTEPGVQILERQITIGKVNRNSSLSVGSETFKIRLSASIPDNREISLLITYSDGSYQDFQFIKILVNPTYLNINENQISTTIAGNGRIGYQDYAIKEQGIGFGIDGKNVLFEMGLILGSSESKISNNVRSKDAEADNDFVSTQRINEKSPGKFSLSELIGQFNDENAGASKSNLTIDYRSMVWKESPYDNFIILQYTLTNNNSEDLNDFYFGMFADWDISENGQEDKAGYLSEQNLGYIYSSTQQNRKYAGIQALTGVPNYYAIDNDNDISGNPLGIYDGFSDQEKYESISSGFMKITAGESSNSGNDVSHVISQGPFNIPVGENIELAFAIHGATQFDKLKKSAIHADSIYNFTLKAQVPTIESEIVCYGANIQLTAQNASKFKWYDSFTGGDYISTGSTINIYDIKSDTTIYVSNADHSYESVRAKVNITVAAVPTIKVIGNEEFCDGDSVILQAFEADEYLWSNGQTTQSIVVKKADNYGLEVKDTNLNCISESPDSIETKVLTRPVSLFSIINDALEIDKPVFFDNKSVDSNSYYWDFGDGNTSVEINPNHKYSSSNEYIIKLTAFKNNGCSDESQQEIQVVTDLEKNNSSIVKVYPNPVSENYIFIEIPAFVSKDASMEMIDSSGKSIIKKNLTQRISKIDISEITDFLIFKVIHDNKISLFKIINSH